jgi:hypothetical protein
MPSRIIREGIIGSERVNALSERAELFYRKLLNVADDYGRYYASPASLLGACYPLRPSICEADVKQFLSDCVASGLIVLYSDHRYLQVLDFRQQTRTKSKFPQPTANELLNKQKPLLNKCEADVKQMCSLVVVGGVSVGEGVEHSCEAVAKQKSEIAPPVVPPVSAPPAPPVSTEPLSVFNELKTALSSIFKRPLEQPWSYAEETALVEISRRPAALAEFQQIANFRRRTVPDEKKFLPGSVEKLLEKWTDTLDRARNNPSQTARPLQPAPLIQHKPDARPITDEQRQQMTDTLKELKAQIKTPGS